MNENKNEKIVEVKMKKTAKERWNEFKETKAGKITRTVVRTVVYTAALVGGAVIGAALVKGFKGGNSSKETSEEIIDVPADTVEVVEDTTVE